MISDIRRALGKELEPPRLVQLGCVKIGGLGETRKTQSGGTFRLPRKDDHFTITTMHRNAAGDLEPDKAVMETLLADYGDDDRKLRRIPVRLLSNEIDDNLQAAFCWYGGKSCFARSDGKTITWNGDPKTWKRLPEPREEPWDDKFLDLKDPKGNQLLKLHASFNCIIATKQARWGGVYRFRTTSKISFDQLYSSLIHVAQLTGGVLTGMPLAMVVRPMVVCPPPDRRPITIHVVHVELIGGEITDLQAKALELARHQLAFKKEMEANLSEFRKMLPGPGDGEDDDEAAATAQEFASTQGQEQAGTGDYGLIEDEGSGQGNNSDTQAEPEQSTEQKPPEQTPKTTRRSRKGTGRPPDTEVREAPGAETRQDVASGAGPDTTKQAPPAPPPQSSEPTPQEKAEIQINEALSQDWPAFGDFIVARAVKMGMAEDVARKKIGLAMVVLNRKTKENSLSASARRSLYDDADTLKGRFAQ